MLIISLRINDETHNRIIEKGVTEHIDYLRNICLI